MTPWCQKVSYTLHVDKTMQTMQFIPILLLPLLLSLKVCVLWGAGISDKCNEIREEEE